MPDDAQEIVEGALAAGYRHIDTAQMYGNEAEVGAAIAASGIDRADIFVTTKLNNPNHLADDARRSFDESLTKLGTDYVDLFLMHWPLPTLYGGDFVGTYKVMEEFATDGRARAIGVSNFQIPHLEAVLALADVVPAVNQIEIHPHFANREVADFCQSRGSVVESWSPLGRGKDLQDPVITGIAARIGATPAQVALAWHLARGYVTIPKSATPERQVENLAALGVRITSDDVAAIDALDQGEPGRYGPNPDTFAKV